MTEKRKSVLIKPEAHETLKKLAELSGQDLSFVLEEWLKATKLVLDSFGMDITRISLLSTRQMPDNVTVTFLAPVYVGQIAIPAMKNENLEEALGEKFVKLDVNEKLRKRGCPK
jgi:hypothetical protein